MLSLLGFLALAAFVALILTRRLHVLTALVLVPIAAGLIGGFAGDLGPMMVEGLTKVTPTGLIVLFSVLYFSTMIDTGLFDPVVDLILRAVRNDPLRITVGTTLLTSVVALDADGTSTFILVTLAMLPVYKRVGMKKTTLMSLIVLPFFIMNAAPWGGPTTRAMAALGLSVSDVFVPMIPVLIVGYLFTLFMSVMLGLRERRRLGYSGGQIDTAAGMVVSDPLTRARAMAGSDNTLAVAVAIADEHEDILARNPHLKRPKLIWVNLALTIVVMVALVSELVPAPAVFIIGFILALVINYRDADELEGRIRDHAGNALWATALIFAAGIFTGVFNGTGMIEEMAQSLVAVIPSALGPLLGVITALLSFLGTQVVSADAFYYGMLPVLAQSAESFGITAPEIARAALVGQMGYTFSALVGAVLLLSSLVKVDFIEHQKATALWALGCFGCMLAASLVIGVI